MQNPTSKYLALLLLLVLLLSCNKSDDDAPPFNSPDDNPTTQGPDFEVPTIIPTGEEAYLNLDSDYIFDQDRLPTFQLEIQGTALAEINGDPAAEEYVEGMLIFEGDTISPVGVRYKGSIGAFVGCLTGLDWANPSGTKTCTKLSMKIKINWEGREEKFYGLKKVQLHSQNNDDSQMHERLGYWLFRQMGVPGPRCVHARLMINGEYNGLFALTENVDGRFTRYNFDDGEGNLYKEIWPLQMNGQAHSEQTYLNHLKTNEDENPTAEQIKNFAVAVANASNGDLQSVIASHMNIYEALAYAVVDRTIRHDDGPFHWYCGGGNCSPHNFYWYEEPTAGTMHLIPWDLDHAFINIITDTNPVTPIADAWGETSNNCNPFGYGAFNFSQWSAACDRLTGGWASFEDEYQDLKTQFLEGPFSEASVNAQLDAWELQIREATEEARELHSDAVSVSQWESAMSTLEERIEHARGL